MRSEIIAQEIPSKPDIPEIVPPKPEESGRTVPQPEVMPGHDPAQPQIPTEVPPRTS